MSNLVENNNSYTSFEQIWSQYVFTDKLPETLPDINTVERKELKNKNEDSICSYYVFEKAEDNLTYDYLIYISNFKLTKEFRQKKLWKFEWDDNEENLRRFIIPGTVTTRIYTPTFTNGSYTIPYTSIDPEFDFSNCRIKVGLDFEKLYISGWLYIGQDLQKLLHTSLPPFDDRIWLLKNNTTQDKASIQVQETLRFKLPKSSFDDTEDSNTILTTNILNQALASFGVLDEGEYW